MELVLQSGFLHLKLGMFVSTQFSVTHLIGYPLRSPYLLFGMDYWRNLAEIVADFGAVWLYNIYNINIQLRKSIPFQTVILFCLDCPIYYSHPICDFGRNVHIL